MKVRKLFLLLMLAAILSPGLFAGGKAEKESLAKTLDDYGRFLVEGDVESWLALHDEDVVKMPPHAPSKDYEQMAEEMRGTMKVVEFISFECDNRETVISGDYGWNRGTYTVQARIRANGALPPETDGKYLTISRKDSEGNWKIIRDCFNSNIPEGGTDPAEFNRVVKELFAEYGRANIAGDVDAFMALHDQEVIKMPQDRGPIVGFDALEKGKIAGKTKIEVTEFEIDVEETEVFGDYGWAMGTYWVTRKLKSDGSIIPRAEGKYLTLFKRQSDGSWKILRDSYSSNEVSQ